MEFEEFIEKITPKQKIHLGKEWILF